METGKAAAKWLDTHLDSDQRWTDGVASDTAPWIADAFADLTTLTAEDLAIRAAALDASDAAPQVDVGAADVTVLAIDGTGAASVDVAEWLTEAAGFSSADDVAFVVDIADLTDDDSDLTGSADPHPSALIDPFDTIDHASGTGFDTDTTGPIGDRSAPVPADDIVTAPETNRVDDSRPDAPVESEYEAPLIVASDDAPIATLDEAAPALADGEAFPVIDGSGIDDSLFTTLEEVDDLRVDHVDDDGTSDGGSGPPDDDSDGGWSDAPAEWVDD